MFSKDELLRKLELLCSYLEAGGERFLSDEIPSEIMERVNFKSLDGLQASLHRVYRRASRNCPRSWKFVSLCLEFLLSLKDNLKNQSEEAERLLSVAQQRSIRTLLEQVINIGLLDNLLPGVNPLPHNETPVTPQGDFEKYQQLCVVTLALLDLSYDNTFHGVLIPQFLNPVMCALCQLTMAPIKKSFDLRIERERGVYEQYMFRLTTKLYQPMVIKELMVIEGNRKCPRWLKRGVGQLLTDALHRPQGVQAVVQAIRDAASSSNPSTSAHLEAVAHVISASPQLHIICPQILELLDSSDAEMIRVAALSVKSLYNKEPSKCDPHLLHLVTKPLYSPPSSEDALALCLQRLHKLFAVPASDFWCLPSQLLQRHIHVLFLLYCEIYQSAVHIRNTVEDLVWCFLSNCEGTVLTSVFRCLIYRQEMPGIANADGMKFLFGDSGGVQTVQSGENESSLEDYGDTLMILLERRDRKCSISNRLFVDLLKFAAEEKRVDTIQALEQNLVTVKLLAVLSENDDVQKSLSKNPRAVVDFLKSMIENFSNNQSDEIEIISIALVVLNVILKDYACSKNCDWAIFDLLVQPLSLLMRNSKSKELQLLAKEAYEVILTHGAVKSKAHGSCSMENDAGNSDKPISSCDEALKEACDALLPVRGVAIKRLAKLLASGDEQARAKKDQILCILQENLKEEDSFLYLSAVEGLATVAAEFPDSAIFSLIEQYGQQTISSDMRLKVGEVLIRVMKLLGELVPVYKAELINVFLTGTRDDDYMVRMSSLSNLGELCRLLGFRVGPIVAEVLMCAHCVVCSDPAVEVRRSAVLLIYLMLKGLRKDTFNVLQDVLLELYQTLKRIHSSDRDETIRVHAQLALEELNSSTLAFLFPTPQLSKNIFVLDPPLH